MLKQAASGVLDTREASLVKRVSGLTFQVWILNLKLDAANDEDGLLS